MLPGVAGVVDVDSGKVGMNESLAFVSSLSPPMPGMLGSVDPKFVELLTAQASAAERRGEILFSKPFPHDPGLSCAGCHVPSAAFVDHRQHDVGSGGLYKTPTLLNADFNAPYFHDGRYDTFDQVVAHFDRVFALCLSPENQHDLVAYLTAVGDGQRPYENNGVAADFKEISDFVSTLDTAIPAHDKDITGLTVNTVGPELRELTEAFPNAKDTSVTRRPAGTRAGAHGAEGTRAGAATSRSSGSGGSF